MQSQSFGLALKKLQAQVRRCLRSEGFLREMCFRNPTPDKTLLQTNYAWTIAFWEGEKDYLLPSLDHKEGYWRRSDNQVWVWQFKSHSSEFF